MGRFGTDDKELRVESAKMLAATYFFLQGTPFIYEGQEIGMTNAYFESMDEIKDVESHNIYRLAQKVKILKPLVDKHLFDVSRDNARTPMLWDDSEYGGFSTVEPWIRPNKNKDTINVKQSLSDDNSIFKFYQKLIAFRKNNEVIRNGEYIDLLKSDKNIFAYKRKLDDKEVVVISNFSNKIVKLPLKEYEQYEKVFSNYDNNSSELKPYETRVYKNY